MQLIEMHHSGRDIRDLMRDAYRQTGSREKAAARFEISRQTFITWEKMLDIDVADEPATVQ